jgi:putative phosphoribosyl transferase
MSPASNESIREDIRIPCDNMELRGNLDIPERCAGIVLFAHGSGSSRLSPRNKYVAGILREAGFGTLLMDLLSPKEDRMQRTRFDIGLLTHRLDAALAWQRADERMAGLPVGLFGSSTGAAAAIRVAAVPEANIVAVVSRGGRPDLADHDVLAAVTAPTLLIVGGNDTGVIALNESAQGYLRCESRMEIVPGATHLFDEPGTLEEVARHPGICPQ